MRASSITRRDVSELHASLKATPYRANRMLAASNLVLASPKQRDRKDEPARLFEDHDSKLMGERASRRRVILCAIRRLCPA
jgi:hypothetical protein